MDRLEEIRKRDAQEIEAVDMWIHHYTACADRRWLLGKVDAQREELGRLRAALEFYADKQNWWQTDPTSIEWQGDPEEFPWDIARRALAGEFTGKIEMVKLYPGLTPEEISNDYKEARGALTGEG